MSAMCGQCLDTVSAPDNGPAEALGRKMVHHYRSVCRIESSRPFADSLETDLDARALAAVKRKVAA